MKNSDQLNQKVSWVLAKVQFSAFTKPRWWKFYDFLSFSHYFLSIQTIVSSVEVDWLNWEYRLEQYLELRDRPKRSVLRRDDWMLFGMESVNASGFHLQLTDATKRNVREGMLQIIMGWAWAGPIFELLVYYWAEF